MDIVTLSRLQFAVTTVYHFFFVPLTLGLGIIIAILETIYVTSGNELYKQLTQFWGKLFLINFAMGVVTGLVMEFQFGMNWSEYSRFIGDIFGAPLAVESILAFFLESTFLGIWVFGWERVSKKVHVTAIWLVVFGSSMSALWILFANGFMQHPVGFVLRNGRAEMVDFLAVLLNPRAWLLFWHTMASGLTTAAFFVLGISAYYLARKEQVEAFRRSFVLAAIVGLFATVMVALAGHAQGLYLREVQPMTAAASESLWETENPASFKVVALFDTDGKKEIWSLKVPFGLSMLYYMEPNGEVEGINDIQEDLAHRFGDDDYAPMVALDFWLFRIMVGLGFLMIGITALFILMVVLKWPEKLTRWLKWAVWIIALPYIANVAGWILTETGRQPWLVTGLLKTRDGVSPNLTPGMVLTTLIGFVLIYGILMAADIYLLRKYAVGGLVTEADKETDLL